MTERPLTRRDWEVWVGAQPRGQPVQVHLTALGRTVEGRINEIVPSADPVSRSFLVKVALPTTEGLYPGMYGKLRIQRGERLAVLISERAIQRVGQLTTVRVRTDGRWERRYVTVGSAFAERREVLSTLSGGEEIGWD